MSAIKWRYRTHSCCAFKIDLRRRARYFDFWFFFLLFFSILFHTQFSIYSIEQRNAVINVKVSLWLSAVSEPVFVDFFSFLFTSRRQKYAMLRSDRRKKKKINCFGFPFDNHKNSENGETIIGFYKVSARIYCQANQWINIERIRY